MGALIIYGACALVLGMAVFEWGKMRAEKEAFHKRTARYEEDRKAGRIPDERDMFD